MPSAGGAPGLGFAPGGEMKSPNRDQVLHCGRCEEVAHLGVRRDALGDVYGDPSNIVAADLDLAGVQSNPDVDSEPPGRVDDVLAASDGARRPVERRQEAVARRLYFAAPEGGELLSHRLVVGVEGFLAAA